MSILQKHGGEIARAIRNHRYDVADNGILVPSMGVFIGGALTSRLYREGELVDVAIDANLIVGEGLNHVLNAALPPEAGYAPITSWYIAPFAGDYNPEDTLKAADFPAAATEFTAYAEATRPKLTIAAAAAAKTTGNSGNEALLVFNAGGPYNLYGGAILSSSAKSSTAGKCLACVRFDNPRLGLVGGDKLGLEYVITAADAS